ncbi:MAG: cyclopropane fatty acyl phospholipid synthase, partial [Saprospiraceae bacterium]|nr:cyclopropane fatty acyl phospholipid synthase [Saprospiraceae bacterium]
GPLPWDIQVYNDRFYRRLITQGSLGLGESYMDGWWDAEKLDEFFYKILKARLDRDVKSSFESVVYHIRSIIQNQQTRRRSQKVARQHYDLGNDFYLSFMDPYNQYTCGYFKETDDLDLAQEHKLDLICRKLQLSEKDRVLDIGCGWGGFAKYAAEHYNCSVHGITISDKQLQYAKQFCRDLPITIEKKDYRDLEGSFDKILVCGMIEHVGYKNYRELIESVHHNLKEKGLFLLHTIGGNTSLKNADRWITKYIFPNSQIPSAKQLTSAIEDLFSIEDWHSFGSYYVPTLHAWYDNFNKNWDQFKSEYGERFYRMWKYYLLSSAGAFRARELQLWQIVLSKSGNDDGYVSIR